MGTSLLEEASQFMTMILIIITMMEVAAVEAVAAAAVEAVAVVAAAVVAAEVADAVVAIEMISFAQEIFLAYYKTEQFNSYYINSLLRQIFTFRII